MKKPTELKSIEVLYSEGNLIEEGRCFETIRDFQAAIDFARTKAPRGGAYSKTGFRFHFTGETTINYTGRIDIHHISEDPEEPQNIVEHVKAFANYIRSEPRHADLVLDNNLVECVVELQAAREEVERLQALIDARR